MHDTPTDCTVAASVRAELARRKISGRRLARDLGWNRGITSRRLSGDVPFRAAEIAEIAAYLGVPFARLVDVESSQASA